MTEFIDSQDALATKYIKLIKLLDNSKKIVFFTGAGISTAADIPDFRGDKGLDKAPLNIAKMGVSERDLDCKMPTYGHRAISVLLENEPRFEFVVTSNHDGLHQKSGTPWDKSANIFGTAYIEQCAECKIEYIRKVVTPSLHRRCDNGSCNGKLRKHGVRYGQTIPVGPLNQAEEAAKSADLVLVLGSSMRTSPFCDLPTLAKSYVICNRQITPHDENAVLCIHDNVDNFMSRVVQHVIPHIKIDFQYCQDFVVKEILSELVVTTPRENEPAVFIDNVAWKQCDGKTRDFEEKLNGLFVLPLSVISGNSDVLEIVVEFKEGFQVENVHLKHTLGNITHGALVKEVTF